MGKRIGPSLSHYLVGGLAALAMSGSGQASDAMSPIDIAQRYIAAYEAQDFDTMRALYASEARFIDPNSFEMDHLTPDIDWHGPDEILAGIASWGLVRGHYRIDRMYEASGRVVFDADIDVVYATPEGEQIYRFPIITILTIENGLVVEHRDYTGFNEIQRLETAP